MKEILIASGKGGTGKTSLRACFAILAGECVLADCDVDASNLPLLLKPEQQEAFAFFAGVVPKIDRNACIQCGTCSQVCRFQAIVPTERGPIIRDFCEGCGVCADHCPQKAIRLQARRCGKWMRSKTSCGTLFHAELLPGAENSGKLIAQIRRAAREEAEKRNIPWMISDGPPGIACPLISSATGADYAVLVAEPTPSGIHDVRRLAEVLGQFSISFSVLSNKADLNPEFTMELEQWCLRNHRPFLGRIPFDPLFPTALQNGKTVLDYPDSSAARQIHQLWNLLQSTIQQGDKKC